jgi:hypothetical protein
MVANCFKKRQADSKAAVPDHVLDERIDIVPIDLI